MLCFWSRARFITHLKRVKPCHDAVLRIRRPQPAEDLALQDRMDEEDRQAARRRGEATTYAALPVVRRIGPLARMVASVVNDDEPLALWAA